MCKGIQKTKEKKEQVFITKEQQELMKKGAQPLPGFNPENQSLSQFQEELQSELVVLHELETKKEIQPAQPVFQEKDTTLHLQRRLSRGERSAVKAERKEAAKIKDKTYEAEQKAKDTKGFDEKQKFNFGTTDAYAFRKGVAQNENSTIQKMLEKGITRQDLTGRQRRENQKKYADTNGAKEKIRAKANQDADNLARNLHMDIMLYAEIEVPEQLQKYEDANYFIEAYGEKVLMEQQERKSAITKRLQEIESELQQLQDVHKETERAQAPAAELTDEIVQKQERVKNLRQEQEKLEQDKKIYEKAGKQIADVVLFIKGAATNGGARLTAVAREIKALQQARDQIKEEGVSAYNNLMVEHLEEQIRAKQAEYDAGIRDYDTCNGEKNKTQHGNAVIKIQEELTRLRREMLKVQEQKEDPGKLKELEDMALNTIRNFSYTEMPFLPKVEIKERADVQFRKKTASYHLQKSYQADELSQDKDVRQQAAEKAEKARFSVLAADKVATTRIINKAKAVNELEGIRNAWLEKVYDQRMKQEKRKKEEIHAELLKEQGQEMQFQIKPEDIQEVPEPAEKNQFSSSDTVIEKELMAKEMEVYYKYAKRQDPAGILRRENERTYRKADPAQQEVKEAAKRDVENLVNNLRVDMIVEEDVTLEPDLQYFTDIYYFTKQYGEEAVLNNKLLRVRQEAELLRLQLKENKDSSAEAMQNAKAQLKRLHTDQALKEQFATMAKSMVTQMLPNINSIARMIRAMKKAEQMIREEGESKYHTEMLRQLEEKIKAAQADYKALYEDLRTLNHSLNENGRAMLQLCNELLDIRQKMKAPGITEDEKAELEELARQKIYTLHADQPEAQV